MTINKNKSGIMPLSKRKISYKEDSFNGYPVVYHYKYLGTTIDQTLKIGQHIKAAKMKATYITNQLYPIRKLDDLKLNKNLFMVFVEPSFRLLYGAWNSLDKKDK